MQMIAVLLSQSIMRKGLLRGHSGQTSNSAPDLYPSVLGCSAFDFAMASDLHVKRDVCTLPHDATNQATFFL